MGVVPEAPAQTDNGSQAHLVHCLFDFLRGPSQHDRPVSRPSPGPVLSGDGFQSCSKGVRGEQRWLCFCGLPRVWGPLVLGGSLCVGSLLRVLFDAARP